VNVDSVVRTLVQRGLIEDAGTDPETGGLLYKTTSYFLERLGIGNVSELPKLAPHLPGLENLADIDDSDI
jgi:segregation and condensation protein B